MTLLKLQLSLCPEQLSFSNIAQKHLKYSVSSIYQCWQNIKKIPFFGYSVATAILGRVLYFKTPVPASLMIYL